MLFGSVNQLAETLTMVYCGIIIGTVYDIFGLIRRFIHKQRWLIHLLDVLFCLVAVLIFGLFAYGANRGQLKIYLFVGALLGLLLQFFGVKPIMKLLNEFIYNTLVKLSRKIKKSALFKRLVK